MAVDISVIKRKFYALVNYIPDKPRCIYETVKLVLKKAHCLPVLHYSSTALSYINEQLNDLNACWNSIYRRIFGFNKWESVRVSINGLRRIDFIIIHAHLYVCLKYYKGT